MESSLKFKVSKASTVFHEAVAFYSECGRAASIDPEDTLILTYLDFKIVGAVRLCFECETYVLRTMQIREDLQGQGIGRLSLDVFRKLLEDRKIITTYCMPYKHLKYFYGLIGFRQVETEQVPQFLQDRKIEFHKLNPNKEVILMAATI